MTRLAPELTEEKIDYLLKLDWEANRSRQSSH
jgi:hypothetical protein